MSVPENRTGIKPVETVKRYEITTSDVRDKIQKRVNDFIAAARKKQMDETGHTDIPDINVNVITYEFSKKFAPFVVMLPEEAIAKEERNREQVMKVFLPEESQQPAHLIKCVWGALASFVYTADEKKDFTKRNSILREELRISRNDCGIFANFCSPKIMKSGDNKVVAFMLDPIRVFSNMVRDPGENVYDTKDEDNKNGKGRKANPNYRVINITFHRITSDNYMYRLDKVPRKKGKNGANFDKKLLNAMRSMMS